MTFPELIKLVDKGWYEENGITSLLDQNGEIDETNVEDDTLALFIAKELKDTFDDDSDDENQVLDAITALDAARRDLDKIIDALENATIFHQDAS